MTETLPLHRLGAVLRYLDDAEAGAATVAPISEIRALLVGDLDRPTHVAVPVAEAEQLRAVRRAAEVAAYGSDDHAIALHALRNVLRERPSGGA